MTRPFTVQCWHLHWLNWETTTQRCAELKLWLTWALSLYLLYLCCAQENSALCVVFSKSEHSIVTYVRRWAPSRQCLVQVLLNLFRVWNSIGIAELQCTAAYSALEFLAIASELLPAAYSNLAKQVLQFYLCRKSAMEKAAMCVFDWPVSHCFSVADWHDIVRFYQRTIYHFSNTGPRRPWNSARYILLTFTLHYRAMISEKLCKTKICDLYSTGRRMRALQMCSDLVRTFSLMVGDSSCNLLGLSQSRSSLSHQHLTPNRNDSSCVRLNGSQ